MTVYYVDNVLIFVLNSLTPQAVCIFKALLFLPQLRLDEYFKEPYHFLSFYRRHRCYSLKLLQNKKYYDFQINIQRRKSDLLFNSHNQNNNLNYRKITICQFDKILCQFFPKFQNLCLYIFIILSKRKRAQYRVSIIKTLIKLKKKTIKNSSRMYEKI